MSIDFNKIPLKTPDLFEKVIRPLRQQVRDAVPLQHQGKFDKIMEDK